LTALVRRGEAAFMMSLMEVILAFLIVALVFGVIINGYVMAAKRSEWTGYALAAQSMGIQTLEQLRSATWDPAMSGKQVDATNLNLFSRSIQSASGSWTNVSGYTTNILDVPWKGTNYVMATNWVSVRLVKLPANPLVSVQVVQVDTVWPFSDWGNYTMKFYTNTICTIIAPDNRDPSTLGD